MSPAPKDPDDDGGQYEVVEEEDYVEDDEDDDEDEEEDFVPGDDDEDNDDDAEDLPVLDGMLSLDPAQKLHYRGSGFHFQSAAAVPWNMLDANVKPAESGSCSLEMTGPCDVFESNEVSGSTAARKKPTPRKLQVTFTVADQSGMVVGKSEAVDDGDDGKRPTIAYQIFGCEISDAAARFEFRGGFFPTDGKEIKLLCQVRMAVDAPVAAAAAPAAVAAGIDDDDDDNIQDADDDGVDYDELIALHADAVLSVDALRKRYRDGAANGDEKAAKKDRAGNDDDDDDIEF